MIKLIASDIDGTLVKDGTLAIEIGRAQRLNSSHWNKSRMPSSAKQRSGVEIK